MNTMVQWNIHGFRSNCCGPAGMQAWGGPVVTPGLHSASFAGWVPRGEAALLIRNGTRFLEIDLKTGLYAAAATICLGKTLTVCSLYLPPNNSPVSRLYHSKFWRAKFCSFGLSFDLSD
ncbi:hypothetical protein PoB_000845100 [Plakobranchus ocellatus]|uniref:Uncharacterized protein n=1 Tax=Plakobranchus ocellatus TaxID=259542 RepID=A0AAV3YFG9_9GAST|nr:hypothetical protein PoB_000845100 [Plakobranchus ocellatus]